MPRDPKRRSLDRSQVRGSRSASGVHEPVPMHDLDRTVLEDAGEGFEGEATDESEAVFDEADEMQLASELLDVGSEQELDQFLGSLVKKATGAIGKLAKTPTGSMLVGLLKSAAKKSLPTIGTALGTAFGGPMGGALGGQLASQAGQAFGLELEGLSAEDQEYEAARRFVRFAGEAAQHAAQAPRGAAPRQAAQHAVVKAARTHAPGLLRGGGGGGVQVNVGGNAPPSGERGQSGRWVRRGRHIILYGL